MSCASALSRISQKYVSRYVVLEHSGTSHERSMVRRALLLLPLLSVILTTALHRPLPSVGGTRACAARPRFANPVAATKATKGGKKKLAGSTSKGFGA